METWNKYEKYERVLNLQKEKDFGSLERRRVLNLQRPKTKDFLLFVNRVC